MRIYAIEWMEDNMSDHWEKTYPVKGTGLFSK